MTHFYPDPLDPTQIIYDPLPDDATKEDIELYQQTMLKTMLRGFLTFLAVVPLLAIMSLFTGCTTPKVVTVERVTHDTLRITQLQHDSILRHDSIFVREHTSGDTVFLEVTRWHTQYRDRWQHDSIYATRVNSIPVPYPVEKPVPRPLSWFQQMQLWLGRLVLVAIAVLAGWFILRWWLRLKKVI